MNAINNEIIVLLQRQQCNWHESKPDYEENMWFHTAITSRKYLQKMDSSVQLTVALFEMSETTYEKELLVENHLDYSAALTLHSVFSLKTS